MPDIRIAEGYVPGAIGGIVSLHALYYHEHWDFGLPFEAKVAADLVEFLGRYDASHDRLLVVMREGRIEGSIAMDGIHRETEGAHLRWFIVSDRLRGKGFGSRLIDSAVDFCRTKGYKRSYLWTFEGLHAARHLYEKSGFKLVSEQYGTQWGKEVKEQRFELRF
jgi:GNAT superfamily N-acetyltransferase